MKFLLAHIKVTLVDSGTFSSIIQALLSGTFWPVAIFGIIMHFNG